MRTRKSDRSVLGALVWALLSLAYLLPWVIAAGRGTDNSGAILLFNLGAATAGWVSGMVLAAERQHRIPGEGPH